MPNRIVTQFAAPKKIVASAVAVVFATTVLVQSAVAAETASVDKTAQKNAVVAVVNGQDVYRAEVDEARQLLPQQYQQLPLQAVYVLLLESLVDRKLAAIEARKKGLDKSEDLRRQLKMIEEQLLQRAYVSDYIKTRVTDEEVRKGYATFVKEFPAKEEIKASHILVETEAEAKEVIKAVLGGKEFAEVAKAKSIGPSGASGGDLGYFVKEAMVPEFGAAAFALKTGETTKEPVKTSFGWHVIKVLDRRMAPPPSLEEAEADIRNDLSRQAGTALMTSLRTGATIKRFNLDGSVLTLDKDGNPVTDTEK